MITDRLLLLFVEISALDYNETNRYLTRCFLGEKNLTNSNFEVKGMSKLSKYGKLLERKDGIWLVSLPG